MHFKIAAALALMGASSALAADRYLDDRSTPDQLIRSLYSAINLHQYSRAYTYYSDPPAKDYDTYAKGFEDTAHVDLLIGDITGEGAAGSTYSNVPIAIRAKDQKGGLHYFNGCYVVRQVNADQDPPYQPLQIRSAKLKAAKEDDFTSYALPKCGDIEPDQSIPEITLDDVKARFVSEAGTECDKAKETEAGLNEPEVHEISWKGATDDKDTPASKATLYLFSCSMAAYNESFVAYMVGADGLSRLSFALPHLKIAYKDQDDAKLKSMSVDGYESHIELVNASFDAKSNTMIEFDKWRGVADASSNASWVFSEGEFVLKDYDVDPTYDGNINAMPVMKDGKLVLKP